MNRVTPAKPIGGHEARRICEGLGFDPTNHHNAAKCPYCSPPSLAHEVALLRAGSRRQLSDGFYVRGQVWISPAGLANVIKHNEAEKEASRG